VIPLYIVLQLKSYNLHAVPKTPDVCGTQTGNAPTRLTMEQFALNALYIISQNAYIWLLKLSPMYAHNGAALTRCAMGKL